MGVVYGPEDWAVGKRERDLEMEYNIKLEVYFEVKDSEVYGGLESVGYASTGINGCKINYVKESVFNKKELMEEYIKSQREGMAKFCKVPLECVRTISKEEYDSYTDDD